LFIHRHGRANSCCRQEMNINNQPELEKMPEPENPYFAVQADWGMTKHMGGLKATEKLVDLCRISRNKHILVVGCGVGTTSCYIAQKHGCWITAVDISAEMVRRSTERARKEAVEDKIEFRVADAQNLPFEDNTFDAVICESVNAFIENKQGALNQYVRVLKPGGFVGINEVTWLKDPPLDLAAYLSRVMGAEFLTGGGWKDLFYGASLVDTVSLVYKTNVISQWFDEVRQFEIADFIKAWGRYFLSMRQPAARKFTREALSFPRSIINLFEYFGYGLYAGRK
jgi:ubiquinone/menaquinone biosynthesis C-methylase UbiE